MFLFSLIAGSIEASIEIMAIVIPFVLMVCFYVFIVIPIFLIELVADLIKRLYCHIRKKEYIPPAYMKNEENGTPASIKDLLPKPKPKPVKVKVVKKEQKKKSNGITIDEILLYDIIDDD